MEPDPLEKKWQSFGCTKNFQSRAHWLMVGSTHLKSGTPTHPNDTAVAFGVFQTMHKKKFWGPQSQRKARFGDPKWQQFLQSSSLVKNSSKCFWASSDLRLKAFSNDPCNASGVSAKLVEAGGELPKQWLPGYPLLIKHRAEKSSGYPVTSGIFQTYSISDHHWIQMIF
jgi:hypothetical protein